MYSRPQFIYPLVHSQFSPSQNSLYSSSIGLPYASTIPYFDASATFCNAKARDGFLSNRLGITENVENFENIDEPLYYDCDHFTNRNFDVRSFPIKEEEYGEI